MVGIPRQVREGRGNEDRPVFVVEIVSLHLHQTVAVVVLTAGLYGKNVNGRVAFAGLQTVGEQNLDLRLSCLVG